MASSSSSSTPPKSKIFPHFPSLFRTFSHFLSPFLFAFFLIAASSAAANSPSTIYDYLRLHGLPIGLLPKGITEFSQDPSTGFFQVMLNKPCNAKFENQVHYDFNVTGTLTFGRIGNLSGVSAQELFLWFPVKGIRVDVPSSGLIYFDVGVVDKQFSLSLFESPPDCTADPTSNAAGFENYQIDDLKSGSQNAGLNTFELFPLPFSLSADNIICGLGSQIMFDHEFAENLVSKFQNGFQKLRREVGQRSALRATS